MVGLQKLWTVAAMSVCIAIPSMAKADPAITNAENIRKLNIMLMVTSLRCRAGEHDFQADYQQFGRVHRDTINRAGAYLSANWRDRHGAKKGKRALDRLSVGIANSYGQGHPWMDCAALKSAVVDLVKAGDSASLSEAADDMLGAGPRAQLAAN